uniref:Ovule protein n=1 Tax=Heterorhabditis bacteriophora TaxID=37862 RepID=A0A1I7X2J3_HETBA
MKNESCVPMQIGRANIEALPNKGIQCVKSVNFPYHCSKTVHSILICIMLHLSNAGLRSAVDNFDRHHPKRIIELNAYNDYLQYNSCSSSSIKCNISRF